MKRHLLLIACLLYLLALPAMAAAEPAYGLETAQLPVTNADGIVTGTETINPLDAVILYTRFDSVDENGLVLACSTHSVSDGTDTVRTLAYDEEGRLLREDVRSLRDGQILNDVLIYRYDSEGRISAILSLNEQDRDQFVYDEAGHVLSFRMITADQIRDKHNNVKDDALAGATPLPEDAVWSAVYSEGRLAETELRSFHGGRLVTVYTWHEDGYTAAQTSYDADDTVISTAILQYARDGKLLSKSVTENGVTTREDCAWDDHDRLSARTIRNKDGQITKEITLHYAASGIRTAEDIRSINNDGASVHTRNELDADQRVVRHVSYGEGGRIKSAIVYSYNKQGLVQRETHYNDQNQLHSYTTFTYDERGLVTEEITYNSNKNKTGSVAYTYDDQGRLLTETISDRKGVRTKTIQWRYNDETGKAEYRTIIYNKAGKQNGKTGWQEK